VATFTGLGGSFPVDWVATFTGIRKCYLTPAEKACLLDEIASVIDPIEDRFILLRLLGAKHQTPRSLHQAALKR